MYKLHIDTWTGIQSVSKTNQDGSGVSFLLDPANTDYQRYLKWLEEGNTPLPADEQGEQA